MMGGNVGKRVRLIYNIPGTTYHKPLLVVSWAGTYSHRPAALNVYTNWRAGPSQQKKGGMGQT